MAAITYQRQKNNKEVTVTRSATRDSQTLTETAVLKPYMYDVTTITISGDESVTLEKLHLGLSEVLGDERKSIDFNMRTRFSESGEDEWDERIFYGSLVPNEVVGGSDLTIYIPHKCSSDGVESGYLDSVVRISLDHDGEDISVAYRTNIPPCVINGVPKKRNPDDEDPVLPAAADRVDFGKGIIPSYYDNSRGYQEDYLFTNSIAVYQIEASGFIPEQISGEYGFTSVSAFMRNPNTDMRASLPIVSTASGQSSMDVMEIDGISAPFTADFDVHRWTYDLISDAYSASSGVIYSDAEISATFEEV